MNHSHPPTQKIIWKQKEYTLTWLKQPDDFDLHQTIPITQAYGICITSTGDAVILDQKGNQSWTLPGGTIEKGETPIEALIREVMEEADITIEKPILVGVQKVESHEKTYYQTRFVTKVINILTQTVDPALNRIHERRFVPARKITDYIKWGNTGDAMFADALEKAIKHGILR